MPIASEALRSSTLLLVEDWAATNRALWDERVPIHLGSEFYDLEGFLGGRSSLRPFEPGELGQVKGRTLVHPQCHIGLDTLSWARLGAQVTGLDFSAPAVAAADEIAGRMGLSAEFVQGEVYDAPAALGGRRFDIVYTGVGAILWLPDIERWAETMAALLAPGGRFYMVEFHPFAEVFSEADLTLAESYFDRGPHLYDEPGTYADLSAETEHNRSVEWRHGLGDVVSALADAGLRIELLHEHDFTVHAHWPFLEQGEDGLYRVRSGTPSVPLMYSLRARPA